MVVCRGRGGVIYNWRSFWYDTKDMPPDPEKRTSIPGSAAKYAIKVLFYDSVLCTSATAYGTSKSLGVKNVRIAIVLFSTNNTRS